MRIAVIPARGGSKRIPKKNIKLFHGKPLIAYSIELAIQSGLFDKVVVSTDDHEIAAIAGEWGAEVPFLRPEGIANDTATTIEVLCHAERFFQGLEITVDYYCCIYPTAPLLQLEYLKQGLLSLESDNSFNYALSVVQYQYPVFRSFLLDDGKIQMLFPEHYGARSQDLQPVYHDAGQFYWWRAGSLNRDSCFFSHESFPVVLHESHVCDIDTMDDFELALLKYTNLK